MGRTWALIPVKTLKQSKSRLGPLLSADECARLSRAMLEDVLDALTAATRIDAVALLTDDPEISALGEQRGHKVLPDEAGELCAALDTAAIKLKQLGADTIAVVPSDMPTITGNDIDQLLAEHSEGLSLCSAYRDGGTNILVCSPPDALPFQYGDNSAQRHMESAKAASLPARLVKRTAFGKDIDTPDDLLWLAQQTGATRSKGFLQTTGIAARISRRAMGASA